MGITILNCIITGILILAFQSTGISQTTKKVSMPLVGNYVLRFETEKPGPHKYATGSSKVTLNGREHLYVSALLTFITKETRYYALTMYVFEEPVTLESWVNKRAVRKPGSKSFQRKIHRSGYNDAMGRRTYFELVSPLWKISKGKYVNVNSDVPTGITYIAKYDQRVILEVKLDDHLEVKAMTGDELARFADFSQNISITKEEFFESKQKTYAYASPALKLYDARNRSGRSVRFTYASVKLVVPKSWIVSEKTLDAAKDGTPGRIVLDFVPFGNIETTGTPEKLTIMIEGLPDKKLKSSTYSEAAERALYLATATAKKLGSRDITGTMTDRLKFGGHCLSAYKGSKNSGGVTLTVYEGRDAKARPIKILQISCGGYYIACNYLYSASPEVFDRNMKMIEKLLYNIDVYYIGPKFVR